MTDREAFEAWWDDPLDASIAHKCGAWAAWQAALAHARALAEASPPAAPDDLVVDMRHLATLKYQSHTAHVPAALERGAARIEALTKERVDWARRFKLNDVTPWEWMTRAESAERALADARAALQELVACKDTKDQADYNLLYAQTTGSLEKGKELTEEYRRRKPAAWSAARAVLAGAPAGASPQPVAWRVEGMRENDSFGFWTDSSVEAADYARGRCGKGYVIRVQPLYAAPPSDAADGRCRNAVERARQTTITWQGKGLEYDAGLRDGISRAFAAIDAAMQEKP